MNVSGEEIEQEKKFKYLEVISADEGMKEEMTYKLQDGGKVWGMLGNMETN